MVEKYGTAQSPVDLESEALVKGQGQYTDDIAPAGALHGVFVRSTVAHGIIRSIDTAAAAELPGVLGIYTARDLADAGTNPIMFMVPLMSADGKTPVPYVSTPRPALAGDRVRHIGEAIALVVADSAGAAQDAADLVEVDIEELTAHIGTRLSEDPVEDPIWDEAPNNQAYTWYAGDQEAVQATIAASPYKVTLELNNQRLAGSPMEPRAATASFDPESGRYTLYAGSQGTMFLRKGFADALGVGMDKVHVISKDVGGGFGLKVYVYPEYVAISVAARLLGQAVRWTATRSEALQADQGGRDSHCTVTGGFDADGQLNALYCDIIGNMGAYSIGIGPRVPSSVIAENIVGPYATPLIGIRSRGVHSNTIPTSPYRGAGRPETTYMLERLMDEAAIQLDIDRVELRRRNLIDREQMPFTNQFGHVYDSGDFAAVLDGAMASSDWAGFEARRAEAATRGKLRGIGCALFVETAGAYFQEPLDFRVTEDGMVEVRVVGVSTGQRHRSTITHIACSILGIPLDKVRYIAGDSDDVPVGSPTVGSRVGQMTGSAMHIAAHSAIERGRAIVGHLSSGQPNDITFANGVYTVAGTGETMAFLDLPRRLAEARAEGREIEETLDAVETFQSPGFSFPNGCHVAEVEVDELTGEMQILNYTAVDDCGNVINHREVEAQLMGGIAQGIGQGIMEQMVYDESGQLLSGSFMDYAMPRITEMPQAMTIVDLPDPTPSNPLGAKGVGESGTTASVSTVANAVADALRARGVTNLQTPLTASRLWEAMRTASA
ncbi:MAG: xanthine dehydrogenase family protein molybdopterin-binding subunit [Rhodobacteraceae bacterium]|nr:xanthine dehydrogenase family protein molybdopterin-binding subunit [Paracoccaceae bacterium]MBR9821043.1 xanthine dehydrogenase family protein molybdopterin-binding subunit [Paracoccaceae bacterium]